MAMAVTGPTGALSRELRLAMAQFPARIGLELRAIPATSARMAEAAVAVVQVVARIRFRPPRTEIVWEHMEAVAAQVVTAVVPAAVDPRVAVRSQSSSSEMRRLCPTTRSCEAPVARVEPAVQVEPVLMAAPAPRAV